MPLGGPRGHAEFEIRILIRSRPHGDPDEPKAGLRNEPNLILYFQQRLKSKAEFHSAWAGLRPGGALYRPATQCNTIRQIARTLHPPVVRNSHPKPAPCGGRPVGSRRPPGYWRPSGQPYQGGHYQYVRLCLSNLRHAPVPSESPVGRSYVSLCNQMQHDSPPRPLSPRPLSRHPDRPLARSPPRPLSTNPDHRRIEE